MRGGESQVPLRGVGAEEGTRGQAMCARELRGCSTEKVALGTAPRQQVFRVEGTL